jgi:hypothetical protein
MVCMLPNLFLQAESCDDLGRRSTGTCHHVIYNHVTVQYTQTLNDCIAVTLRTVRMEQQFCRLPGSTYWKWMSPGGDLMFELLRSGSPGYH